tara:strand:+ start:3045 stop:3434 length:390 start_codon:yes stop_codon:yes gene_type:complete
MLVWIAAGAAQADGCANLRSFALSSDIPEVAGVTASCSRSVAMGGGTSWDCYWRFEYRSVAASQSFKYLADVLAQCASGPVNAERSSVNHPDSFDQIIGTAFGRQLSVSLKDKGGLGQSLVFLRSMKGG